MGRDWPTSFRFGLVEVSIHAPTWGATPNVFTNGGDPLFQSTRPRGARLISSERQTRERVSIHAPTWGATARQLQDARENWFQSTRPRGARQGVVAQLNALSMFQSTRPRGARLMCSFSFYVQIVSIHAPTWGATFYRSQALADSMFQSTRPRGARHVLSITLKFLICFNPRAHVGRDRRDLPWRHATCGFNPRAHVGRDQATQVVNRNILFQSTRPRGARLGGKSNPINISVSIHAPTWGATRAC